MSESIKVSVVEFADRKHYQAQWRDPMTGRKKTQSTEVERTSRKRERDAAERAAAKIEAQLREGRYQPKARMTWADFRERYEAEVLPGLADGTGVKVSGVFNAVEDILSPQRLRDVTAARLSFLQSKLREKGLAETTIAGHLAHLRSALAWAVKVELLPAVPTIHRPKRAKQQKMMKGRPITREEFERMLGKVESVLAASIPAKHKGRVVKRRLPTATVTKLRDDARKWAAEAAPAWRYYLEGLWWSGLRLAESLELWWDRDDRLCIDLTSRRPMLRIPAALEKGNQDRLLPIAPEFAELLLRTPEAERTGRVFNLPARKTFGERLGKDAVSRIVAAIGKAAGVKVNTDAKSGAVKYASAHDLRRSFGERWASRIMPQLLMQLMRHESIETTMRFYVGRNAETAAEALWAAVSNTSGNSGPNGRESKSAASSQSVEA